MDPLAILSRLVDPAAPVYGVLVVHSVLVARKAREIAMRYRERRPEAAVDLEFLVEAALLHDVGIVRCAAAEFGCRGTEPYIRHGVLGREILEAEGLPRHALVCERHTGAGITAAEVAAGGLVLPPRDYLPLSTEEKIICVADKLYSKSPGRLWDEIAPHKIARKLAKFGDAVLERWRELEREFLA